MYILFIPPLLLFVLSYFKVNRVIMALIASTITLPVAYIFFHPFVNSYFIVDKLNSFILLLSSIVSVGVSLGMVGLPNRVELSNKSIKRFYRFFGIFWFGLIISILSNNMGLFWIGLEFATLSTVYMIKVKDSKTTHREAWKYLTVGAIAISLILFGIILIYASGKEVLGEKAMNFYALANSAPQINHFLFEMGFVIAVSGFFIKMGFFPMNLWLADVERASIYTVPALFSGILESAILLGFFRLSKIQIAINESHLIIFTYIYAIITLFIVTFLIYRTKDFVSTFALSGIEHMVLIVLFWVSGGYFASLFHLAAHAFLKPALFLSSSMLEQTKRYNFKGALRGYKNSLIPLLISLLLLGIISIPPSPMFFSEIFGFKAMLDLSEDSNHFFLMIFAIFFIMMLLSIIFYKFITIYQEALYDGENEKKVVYKSEILMLILFVGSLIALLLPPIYDYIKGIS
jgi:hydrogenase-4 component F